MKANELREMSQEQLLLTLKEYQETLFRLRFQAQTEKLEAPSEMRRAKRDVARVKTILRERDLAGAAGRAPEATTSAQAAEEQHE